MRKFLLPEHGNFYKANLHGHSTFSDGRLTVEEIKKAYMEHGYSIFAYTDHNILYDHSELTDENFLALTGYEINIENPDKSDGAANCTHINLIAKNPHNTKAVCFNPKYSKYRKDLIEKQQCVGTNDFERVYSSDCVNKIIKEANENGFLVSYNHPEWSLQTWEDYHDFRGLFALEVYNADAYRLTGRDHNNEAIYDYFLRNGIDICPIATDDNHNRKPMNHPRLDSFCGWIMVKADKLDYESVIEAMENKNFYASTGPEIKEAYIENGMIHVFTSPCEFIRINWQSIQCLEECGESKGDSITECHFEIPQDAKFLRITVSDFNGNFAWSNAYYL